MNENARRVMLDGRTDLDLLGRVMTSADELLRAMDAEGVARAALINSVAPDTLGITDMVNPWVARYVEGHRDRLVPVGGIHPRHSRDVVQDMKKLLEVYRLGAIKLHPPHMEMAANAYRTDCPSLADVYRLAGEAKRPVLIHTGTSIFPGARNVYADPMACDDVAVDFPGTTLVLSSCRPPSLVRDGLLPREEAPERPPRHLGDPAAKAPRGPAADLGDRGQGLVGDRLALEGSPLDAPERGRFPLASSLRRGASQDPFRQRGGALFRLRAGENSR